jgi:hypothetical protein
MKVRNILEERLKVVNIYILLPIFLVLWSAILDPLRRLDLWWHIKVGEIIFNRGQIPTTDLFSFTEYGKEFAYPNWLAEVTFFVILNVGGLELLIVLNTLIIVLTFIVVLKTAFVAKVNPRLFAVFMLIPAISFAMYSNLRTQTFAFLFLALFMLVLWNYRLKSKKYIWFLPILMIVWVNIHGSYIIGLGVVAVFLGGESFRYVVRRWTNDHDVLDRSAISRLVIVLFLVVVATLINPYGGDIYRYVQQVGSDPSSQIFVTEWQPPRITNIQHVLSFYLPFLATTLIFIYSRSQPDWTEIVLFGVFTLFGFTAVRNGIWFTIVMTPIAARHLVHVSVPLIMYRRHVTNSLRPVEAPVTAGVIGILVAITVLFSPWVRPHLGVAVLRPSLVDEQIPLEAFAYIEQHGISGRMFHHQDFGDYIIWRLWPQLYTFIDGRVHLFSLDVVHDYLNAIAGREWERIMDKYQISYIFLPKSDQIPLLAIVQQSSNWRIIFED